MDAEPTFPTTLLEAAEFFADADRAHAAFVATRWPDGVVCPHCGTVEPKSTYLAKYRRWKCNACKKQFTAKVGTIFEDSPIALSKWLPAVWLVTNAKNGISSCELGRAIKVTQKTAWFMLHRIRLAMQIGGDDQFSGTVEADETFIGGLEKNKHAHKKQHAGRGGVGKEIVMGILQRGSETSHSKVRAKVIGDTTRATLHAEVRANVEPGSEVFTDAHAGYTGLSPDLEHQWVDHAVQYVEGRVHTNNVENFWSLFKRMLKGTYIHMDPDHLQAYVDEETARYNMRKGNDQGRFLAVIQGAEGKRITYRELIGTD